MIQIIYIEQMMHSLAFSSVTFFISLVICMDFFNYETHPAKKMSGEQYIFLIVSYVFMVAIFEHTDLLGCDDNSF